MSTQESTIEPEGTNQMQELEAVLAEAPVGFAYFDRALRFRYINEHLCAINGLPAEAHLRRRVREVLPSLAAVAEEISARVLATGRAVTDLEFSGETPGTVGKVQWWRETWYPVRQDREIIGFGAVVVDITERKAAEQAIREKEHFLERVMEVTPALLHVFDLDEQRNVMASRSVSRVLGYTPAELSAMGPAVLEQLLPPKNTQR